MNIIKFTLEYKDLAANFHSGNVVIDSFIKSNLALDCNFGATYILKDENTLSGFYNIGVGQVNSFTTVGNATYYEHMGGAININYLALDARYQHTPVIPDSHLYYGDYLLQDCENRILKLREQVGAAFIVIHSTPEGYHMYHDRNDYEDFEEDMSSFVQESDKSCYKLYKCIDDLVF